MKFNLDLDQIEFMTYDDRRYPCIKYCLENFTAEGAWKKNHGFTMSLRIASLYATFFKEHSATLILENRMIGKMKSMTTYFIGNQNLILLKTTDVAFETTISEENKIEAPNANYDSPKLKITYEFNNQYRKLIINLVDTDLLLTTDSIMRHFESKFDDFILQPKLSSITRII